MNFSVNIIIILHMMNHMKTFVMRYTHIFVKYYTKIF